MLADIPQTWDEVWAMPPGIYSWVQLQPITGWQPDDTPSGALRVQLTIHRSSVSGIGDTKTCVLEYVDGATNLTRYFGEGSESTSGTTSDKGRWARIATASTPQEFDLPLADGWSGWAKYSKDQFGRVLVYGLVAKSTALISGDVIGTFPEGFRPSDTCPMTITSNNATGGESFATSGYVQPSGALTLSNGTISSGYNVGSNIAFNFVFPAAD